MNGISTFTLFSYTLTILGLVAILSLVVAKNFRSRVNQGFLYFGAVTTAYVITSFNSEFLHSHAEQLFWTRVALMVANFIPVTFFFFTFLFTGKSYKNNRYFYLSLLLAIILVPLAFSPLAIGDVANNPYGVVLTKTGPILWLTLVNFVLVFPACFYLLSKYAKNAVQSTRSQVKLITYSIAFVIVVNMVTQIVLPEFHINAFGNIVGNPSILVFVGAVGYSILRHKLFDIRSVVLKSIGFVVTLFMVILVFSVLILVPSRLIFHHLVLTKEQEYYFILSATILAFIFTPLKIFLEKITNQIFYQDNYDSAAIVNEIGKLLASEIVLTSISGETIKILCNGMKIRQVDIIVLNGKQVYYEAERYFSSILPNMVEELQKINTDLAVTDELVDGIQRETLKKYGIQAFAQLKVRDEKVGYLLFSEKVSGSPYNFIDIRMIGIVADQLAIAIQNSRSYAQIQRFNLTLQKKVEESTSQLILANERLKKLDATKDDFISLVSHQLGTPLAVMDGFLTLVNSGVYGKVNEKMGEAIKKTLARARAMERLVFDLLNISRMTAGKFFLEFTQVDFGKIVAEEVAELEIPASEKSVDLTYHEPENDIELTYLDEPKTRQAVMNLINNAIFYAPNGKVDVYLESKNGNIVFRVIDNGIGVPDNQKSKLFTKFFRADNARKESPNGTGIGLYLVKRVVEDQGGKLIFSSVEDKGSTFGFSLPIRVDMPEQEQPENTDTEDEIPRL